MSKSWDGHASDTPIFQERAEALVATVNNSLTPRYVVADAQLSHEAHATPRNKLGFLTRIPGTLTLVAQGLAHALRWDVWQALAATTPLSTPGGGP